MSFHPLSAIYGGVVGARNTLYDRAYLPARRLRTGDQRGQSFRSGGSGKTPFVILLGELLKARGIEFDVLSRGYGRRAEACNAGGSGRIAQRFW